MYYWLHIDVVLWLNKKLYEDIDYILITNFYALIIIYS